MANTSGSEGATPDLIRRFRGGDLQGYAILFSRYQPPLLRFVRAHRYSPLEGRVEVEDVVQEVHVEAMAALRAGGFQYRRELSFFLWLCGIARRRIAHHARRLSRSVQVRVVPAAASSMDLLAHLSAPGPTPSAHTGLREELHYLALGLAALPDRRRRALVLRYVEGCDGRDAAARMELTHGAFRVLLTRSLVQLRGELDRLLGS